jgi:Ca2+-binding EF-hand superfamily protein
MKNPFRSRLPPPLTPAQITYLSTQSHLSTEDIEEWYERFNHCYPRGYLSCQQFLNYLKQFDTHNGNENHPTKRLVKQLFRIFDLNEDKHLNFEEFLLFNILINQGTTEKKLKLILTLYDKDKKKSLTRQQLETVLSSMFELLNIPKPTNGFSQKIDTVLTRANFNNQNAKISWNTFSTSVLNDPSLLKLLLSSDTNADRLDDDEVSYIITRF